MTKKDRHIYRQPKKQILDHYTTRRSFLKVGATTGAGLIFSGKTTMPSTDETGTVTSIFKAAGIKGKVSLLLDGKPPENVAFNVKVSTLDKKRACVHLGLPFTKPFNVRRFDVSVATAE